jgi:hypothetical protein
MIYLLAVAMLLGTQLYQPPLQILESRAHLTVKGNIGKRKQ